ncbi:hypothetical protein C8R47DRAFT_1111824 [Mycena vitilis]|nr:hypothetical protein C8R47DRAFT_1111824 [Mycena vitilis]
MLPSLRCYRSYLTVPFTTVVLVFLNCQLQKYYILGTSEHERPLWMRGGFKRLPARHHSDQRRSVSYARCGDAAAAVSSAARSCNVPGSPVPSMHRKARTYPPPRIRVFGPTRRHPARISLRFALLALRTVTPGLKLSGQGLLVSPATIRTAVAAAVRERVRACGSDT